MKLSLFGRFALALFASWTLGLGMTGCGGGTIAFLWVLGQQYNQIAGFKVDDYTGNLTEIPHEPFTSGGVNPVMLVVKPGGRYVYVLNEGTGGAQGVPATSGNIAVFSVGGDGVLTLQQTYFSQGFDSQWLQMDSSGGYLYVLDKYSPSGDGNGSITAFSTDSASGRLTLITNQQACVNGNCPNYFEVGSNQSGGQLPEPFMMKTAGTCLFIANRTAIVPFGIASGGQLTTATTSSIIPVTGSVHISSITGASSAINVTDDQENLLYRYSIAGTCGLSLATGGVVDLTTYNSYGPGFALIDNSNNYLYVLGQSNSNTNPGQRYSSIAAFKIQSNNELQFLTTYGTGSNPVCSVEDLTNQYIYTSNHNDGTISGNRIDTTTGLLQPLPRGSTFNATGESECLALSNAID